MIHRELKIVCVGDHGSGKSSLLRSLAADGNAVNAEEVFVFDKETIEVRVDSTFSSMVTVTNTSGKENLESIRKEALIDVDGVIACFALTNDASLESLVKKWIPEVRKALSADIPIILVGTKLDAVESAIPSVTSKRDSKRSVIVSTKEAEGICKKYKLSAYFTVSSRNGKGVHEAIVNLLRHATLYKVKLSQNTMSPPGSATAVRKKSVLNRIFGSSQALNKHRLSQKLYEVASDGDTKGALELLSKGAHVSAKHDANGSTPLHIAARNNQLEMLNVLLYAKADLSLQDSNGNTALHVACQNSNYECAKALLDKGANPNCRNLVNSTPLHDAAGGGSLELVQLLVSRGADTSAKDFGGNTPKARAEIAGYPILFEIESDA